MKLPDLERITEITQRLLATTPGEWYALYEECQPGRCPDMVDDPTIYVKGSEQYIAQTAYDHLSFSQRDTMFADAEFIAHAKEDIIYLLQLIGIEIPKDNETIPHT